MKIKKIKKKYIINSNENDPIPFFNTSIVFFENYNLHYFAFPSAESKSIEFQGELSIIAQLGNNILNSNGFFEELFNKNEINFNFDEEIDLNKEISKNIDLLKESYEDPYTLVSNEKKITTDIIETNVYLKNNNNAISFDNHYYNKKIHDEL